MPTPLLQALIFLIQTLFGLYTLVLMLRLMLAWHGSNFFDPLVQFIVRLTRGIIHPLRKIIPNYHRLETSTAVFLFVFVSVKFLLLFWLRGGPINLPAIFLLTCAELVQLFVYIIFAALVIQMIMGWMQFYTPIFYLLQNLTAPILRPFQRLLPPINGIDLSPIPAMICLQLLLILIVSPLNEMAFSLMMS